jgi:ribose/xylose/arabinose/galactoside ABC-type transport system permease subunit
MSIKASEPTPVHAPEAVAPERLSRDLSRRLRSPEFLVIVFLVLMCVVMGITVQYFATEINFQNIGRESAVLIVLTVGVLFVLLVGGIDLSLGGSVALVSVVSAHLAGSMSPGEAFLIAVAMATAVGAFNGVLIAIFDLTPIVVTLAVGQVLLGGALLLTPNGPIQPTNADYLSLAASSVGPVPVIFIAALICMLVGWILLKRFSLGRYVYAVGGNETAAFLAGVPTKRVKLTAYALAGMFAGVAGILLSSRVGSGDSSLGSAEMLDAYAAAFIGGVGFGTGRGTIVGVGVGALLLGVIANGIDLLSLNTDWQYIVSGGLIIGAIGFQKGAGKLRWRRR